MASDDIRMSDEAQEALCGCASAKMMSQMTQEEIDNMSLRPGLGRELYDKMLIYVYGPCMQIPVEDQFHKECMKDPTVKEFRLNNSDSLCRCVGRRAGKLLADDGPVYLEEILRLDPKTLDAYDAILKNASFRMKAYNYVYDCLREINGDPNGSDFN